MAKLFYLIYISRSFIREDRFRSIFYEFYISSLWGKNYFAKLNK